MAAARALWQPSVLSRQLTALARPSKSRVATILLAFYLIQQLRRVMGLRAVSFDKKSTMPRASIPGFTSLTDQIFVREPEAEKIVPTSDDNHPDVVIVYGWGDGLPKHVAKFTDGYRVLYPNAKQILVLSPISKAMFSELQQRSESMLPIVKAIWPEGTDPTSQPVKILAHTMSNTGAVNYASMLNIYQQIYSHPFPHHLLVMDSTPGSTEFHWANLMRWSRAMALGTAGWFPWPFAVTQYIWALSLCVNQVIALIRGSEHAGAWSRKAANNTQYETKAARRLYMYSKEDDLIGWEDIEAHAAAGRQLGWEADIAEFKGSGHVGHMRMHGEQYWKAIQDSWEKAATSTPIEG